MTKKIIEMLSEITAETVTIECELECLGIDSLTFVEFIIRLEDEFNIEFSDEMLCTSKFKTVADITREVERLKGEKLCST